MYLFIAPQREPFTDLRWFGDGIHHISIARHITHTLVRVLGRMPPKHRTGVLPLQNPH